MAEVDYSGNVLFSGTDLQPTEYHEATHVRYVEDPKDIQVNWGGCADPRGILTVGEVYPIERVTIHSWHTKIFLVGIDCGAGFNSVSFECIPPT